jgi:hypothetical protein
MRIVKKGTAMCRLKIIHWSTFSQADNLVLGLEIPPYRWNFCPWTKFPGARNSKNF